MTGKQTDDAGTQSLPPSSVVCLVAATAAAAAAVAALAVLSHEFVVIVMAQMCVHATATNRKVVKEMVERERERGATDIKDLWVRPFTNCLETHSCGWQEATTRTKLFLVTSTQIRNATRL